MSTGDLAEVEGTEIKAFQDMHNIFAVLVSFCSEETLLSQHMMTEKHGLSPPWLQDQNAFIENMTAHQYKQWLPDSDINVFIKAPQHGFIVSSCLDGQAHIQVCFLCVFICSSADKYWFI